MKLVVGILIGLLYLFISSRALQYSSVGWGAGNRDLGFWWAVIATLLAIAGLGAIVGTWIHTRSSRD